MSYLRTVPNPFNLSEPPAWFLAELHAQDPELVIFPSQEDGVYRIARKVPHGHVSRFSLSFMRRRPDTKTYVDHGLAPVTSLLPFVQWGPVVLRDLAEMDVRRAGGGQAAADALDNYEVELQKNVDREMGLELDARNGAAYRAMKWNTGQTVDVATTRRPEKTHRRSVPSVGALNFAGGSAVVIGGR